MRAATARPRRLEYAARGVRHSPDSESDRQARLLWWPQSEFRTGASFRRSRPGIEEAPGEVLV